MTREIIFGLCVLGVIYKLRGGQFLPRGRKGFRKGPQRVLFW